MEKSQSCERNGAPGYDLDDALESEELFDEHFEGLDVAPFGSDMDILSKVKSTPAVLTPAIRGSVMSAIALRRPVRPVCRKSSTTTPTSMSSTPPLASDAMTCGHMFTDTPHSLHQTELSQYRY